MRIVLLIVSLIVVVDSAISQDQKPAYAAAYNEIRGMLSDSLPLSFKRAVFVTENAYFNNDLDYNAFNNRIQHLVMLCKDMPNIATLSYEESDKDEVTKYWSVFMIMKQRKTFTRDADNQSKPFTPFTYDFDDFWGDKDWSKMFVTKLMSSASGNCHSLPFLYKILCEELGAKAYLAMAPNHIYIKHWTKKTGWFNTELTSGYFPIDAWIMASGYVHLEAVQNRIYMDTLSEKQSVAICMIDLAKGYERKFGKSTDLKFVMDCAELAIKYYPNYVNALILKAETKKKYFDRYMLANNAKYPAEIFRIPQAKTLFEEMERLYFGIHQLGFRAMPKEMYISWLNELTLERDKYVNKNVMSNFNQVKK